jgi:hypothetical protein
VNKDQRQLRDQKTLAVIKLTLFLLCCFAGYAGIGLILIQILGLLGGAVAYILRPPGLPLGDHLAFGMMAMSDYLWVGPVGGLLFAVLVIVRAAAAELVRPPDESSTHS